MNNNYKELFKKYYSDSNYIVKDIVNNKNMSKYVFVLESPHNEELKNGYPVAGESGKDIIKFLGINSNDSFGKYVKENKDSRITLINVSKVPLQVTNSLKEDYISLMDEICSIIRCGYDSYGKHRKKAINEIEEIILQDFKSRLKKVKLDIKTNIIVCGNFAKVYFDKISTDINEINKNKVLYVPHPSRKQWSLTRNDLNILHDVFKNNYIK